MSDEGSILVVGKAVLHLPPCDVSVTLDGSVCGTFSVSEYTPAYPGEIVEGTLKERP